MVALIEVCSNLDVLPRTPEELRRLADAPAVERAKPTRTPTRKPPTRLTAQAKADIVARYEAGEPSTSIAKHHGIVKSTVISVLRASGVALRNQPMSPDDVAKAAAKYERGDSLSQLAAALPYNQETIRQALLRAGVTMRPARR